MSNENQWKSIHACLLITAIQECSKAFSQELAVNNYLEEVKLKMAISAEDFNRILTDKQRCDDEGVAQDNRWALLPFPRS